MLEYGTELNYALVCGLSKREAKKLAELLNQHPSKDAIHSEAIDFDGKYAIIIKPVTSEDKALQLTGNGLVTLIGLALSSCITKISDKMPKILRLHREGKLSITYH